MKESLAWLLDLQNIDLEIDALGRSRVEFPTEISRLEEKLRLPAYGNYVDHDKLFEATQRMLAVLAVRITEERILSVNQHSKDLLPAKIQGRNLRDPLLKIDLPPVDLFELLSVSGVGHGLTPYTLSATAYDTRIHYQLQPTEQDLCV